MKLQALPSATSDVTTLRGGAMRKIKSGFLLQAMGRKEQKESWKRTEWADV